ncbi:hypothetical protein EW146_g2160, partial [Bondarzewia mesenterica]
MLAKVAHKSLPHIRHRPIGKAIPFAISSQISRLFPDRARARVGKGYDTIKTRLALAFAMRRNPEQHSNDIHVGYPHRRIAAKMSTRTYPGARNNSSLSNSVPFPTAPNAFQPLISTSDLFSLSDSRLSRDSISVHRSRHARSSTSSTYSCRARSVGKQLSPVAEENEDRSRHASPPVSPRDAPRAQ